MDLKFISFVPLRTWWLKTKHTDETGTIPYHKVPQGTKDVSLMEERKHFFRFFQDLTPKMTVSTKEGKSMGL